MLGKILKKFKKGGDESEEGKKLKAKIAPTDYYAVLFGNFDFSKKIIAKQEKKMFGKINPLKKINLLKKDDKTKETDLHGETEYTDPSKARYEAATKVLLQVKRHFKVEDFRNQWKKLKVKPGVVGHSQVVVYGNIQVSDDKEFPFYVFNNDVGLSCKLDQTPNFTEGRIAVLGTVHTTFDEHPRLYLEVGILYLHKDDFV